MFGITRRRVASFERRVDGLSSASGRGRIDLLWPGTFMAEHKSKGRDLGEATVQALEYVDALEAHERPRWVALSDFERVRLHEVATGEAQEFSLSELPQRVEHFAFLIGRQLRHQVPSDPVNVKAAQEMARLHDLLEKSGYQGHDLELLLVRMLFLLFGDDTGLWDESGLFYDVLADHTRSDGEDLGATLARLFQTLDTPRERRQAGLPAWLAAFPYVNGELFRERLDLAEFSPEMRQMLLDASALDWGAVSPAIFGSMFQAVMDPEERRNLGAHYTSEENILKALGPLFLDDLQARRKAARGDRRRLQAFLDYLPTLRFLDPACGSGNFLLVGYRELRWLELGALVELLALEGRSAGGQVLLDISYRLRVSVEQFYGIEYDEFPSQIARVALWLADHQMNVEASRLLGQNFVNLPLTQAAHIRHGDALEVDWAEHLSLAQDAPNLGALFVMGNPPFIGSYLMSPEQKRQMLALFAGNKEAGVLDYVAAWYLKSAQLLRHLDKTGPHLRAAASLVSTNSITQGEQVPPLWTELLENSENVITAAHQTFAWTNEAPGRAAVHCVIIQLEPAGRAPAQRRLFSYASPKGLPTEHAAQRISPYLIEGPEIIVRKQREPLVPGVPPLVYGNKPVDGGHLIFHSQAELDGFLAAEPGAAKFIKRMLDAQDFLRGQTRWCLWLVGATPAELQKLPRVMERVRKVKEAREGSKSPIIQRFAEIPSLFTQRPHVDTTYWSAPRKLDGQD
ncbi:hypothetical protein QOL99_02315 [Deinococcus sp. MIMF12]|uniref:site-specific DNA-methyltransferase (adenine-specific) n=1 Tax=Deinococcus rhizophilus TaxID=3049544 RepID=A0ABT7JES2_9DEIO|nr:hypothetical protein [Deinococcus rhizophilus]